MNRKLFLIVCCLLMFTAPLMAALTNPASNIRWGSSRTYSDYVDNPLRLWVDEVDGILGPTGGTAFDSILYNPQTSSPTATEGGLFYSDVTKALILITDAGETQIEAGGAGVSLDGSYNLGIAITVDNGAVALTATDAANNTAFQVVQSDTGTSLGIDINNAGSGNSIDIQGTSGSDIEGTDDSWAISIAGAFTGESFTGVTNAQAIILDTNNEIQFGDNSEDVAMVFTSNTVTWATDTAVATMGFGVVDALIGIESITFDAAEASTITQAGTGNADDLTIAQTGTVDVSLILSSAGSITDAISILTTDAVGVIKIASSDILDIDAVDNINMDISGAGANLDIDSAAGSVYIDAGEAAANAIVIDASNAAGGIDIDCGTGTLDIDVAGAINIANSTAVDISIDASAGSFNVDAGEAARDDAIVIAVTGAGSGMRITSLADIDIVTTGAAAEDITITNNGGSFNLTATENDQGAIDIETNGGTSERIRLYSNQGTGASAATESDASIQLLSDDGGIGLLAGLDAANAIRLEANAGTSETIIIHSNLGTAATSINLLSDVGGITATASDGPVVLTAAGASDGDMTLTVGDDYSLDITGDGTFKGSVLPDSIVTTTETTTTLDTTDIGKITKVTADNQTITLPATVVGYFFTIYYAGADGGALITVELDNNDQFLGCDIAGAAGEALLLTKVTSDKGDYVRLLGDGADGWKIVEMNGTWAEASP